MPTVNKPLNRDYTYDIYAPDYTRFRFTDNGVTIYEGKVYPKPGTEYGSINITRILENYVYQNLPSNFGQSSTVLAQITNAYKVFGFQTQDSGGTWEDKSDLGYLYWYDYDENPSSYSTLELNDKVNDHSTTGARYVRSRLANGHVTNTINATAAQMGYDESYCGRFGITYLNRRGGYDFFLFEGKYSVADNYDFHRYNRTYDNTKNGFGYTTYMNSYDTVWTLSTGWLSDEESERFAKHVMGSTQVWLQDIERGVTYPVYMLDTSTEYKKYDGKTLICYTVKLGLSQERKRK